MSKIAIAVNSLFNKFGIEVKRFPNLNERRLINYLTKNKIDTCIDVGANEGQFANALKKIGFIGKVVSFEPQNAAFVKLKQKSKAYKNWAIHNIALGDFDGTSEINISSNSVSSSLLNMMPQHSDAAPSSKYISKEIIEVRKLDSIYQHLINSKKVFLKLDTQGFESKVLKGAKESLENVYALQLEMACTELYEGELLFDDMKKQIENLGFALLSIESGFADDTTGKLLQIEAVFVKL